MENTTENWRIIYDHLNYMISDQGRIKNSEGDILPLPVNDEGYSIVELDGNIERVDMIVVCAFLPCPYEYISEMLKTFKTNFDKKLANEFRRKINTFNTKNHKLPTVYETKFIAEEVILIHLNC